MKNVRQKAPIFWWMLAFALVWLAFRVFWLTGDPGIAAAWEYGYNATDEGYYLGGGKEKFLWGCFVDLARTEVFTYGFSAGTHWLSYLAHLVFGLSTWAWRLPFVLITFIAWIVMYVYLAKKSGALNSFLLCLAFSLLPMTIAYERTASNDVLIGSLAVIAYVIAAGKERGRIFASALVTGAIVLVKPSVWVLIPVIAAGILRFPKFKQRGIDIALYLLVTIACVFAFRLLVAVSVLPDAQRAGVTIWDVVKRTTTHYPLPSIFDFASHFKGLSAFPRDPSYAMLGVSAVFVFVLPIALALKNLTSLRLNGNTLLFVALPAYVAAINVMNTQYTHYFIPALMFLPIVLDAAAEEMKRDFPNEGARWVKPVCVLGALLIGVFFFAQLFISDWAIAPKVAQAFYSKVYNFPQENVWALTFPAILLFVLTIFIALLFLRGFREARRYAGAWALSAFFASSVVFAALPAVKLAPYLKVAPETFLSPLSLSLVLSLALLILLFGLPDKMPWGRTFPILSLMAIVGCYFLTPNWRAAARQLVQRPTHYHQEVAQELRKLLPDDAIVIGERSNQMLMSLPVRTATTFAANSDPIPVIQSILKAEPKARLYALVDSQHAYNLQHYREHANEYALRSVKVFKMPSFGSGALSDVYFCQIDILPQKK